MTRPRSTDYAIRTTPKGNTMTLLEDFARIFQMPPAMLPHIEFVAQEQEIALVVALGNGPLTPEQIAGKLALSLEQTEALLHVRVHPQHREP